MKRVLPALVLLLPLVTLIAPSASQAADAAVSITVAGDGVAMYPAFSPTTSRYAVTGTDGTVTVSAGGGDVRIDGRPAPDGTATLTDVAPGDEISVLIDDAAYALFVTPSGFPTLERTTPDSSLGDLSPGQTLLTLGLFTAPSPYFETAVDANGVPVWVHENALASTDLKLQPDGHYSVARSNADPAVGASIVELDDRFQPIGSYSMIGLPNTDTHDSIFLPDGRRFLIGYEPNADTGLTDAVIQEADASNNVLFQWSSAPYADQTMTVNNPDYAHINSISLTPDGDLLVSFRHLSSVWKIATSDHDGFDKYDVEWRLGGRMSDFTFTDHGAAPTDGTDGGPCAQHTATMLPDGHILVWDNGSSTATTALCVPGSDPAGPAVPRPYSRVAEFALDQADGTADLVKSWSDPDRFAIFAGSARRQPNGDTVVGWAAERSAVASEISSDGTLLWSLRDAAADSTTRQITYRAERTEVADWAPPAVTVDSPAAGQVVDQGAAVSVSFGCTDVGGSTLQTCDGSVADGDPLDTSTPGVHSLTVTATDGAGHLTTVRRNYRVLPASAPSISVKAPGGTWTTSGPVGVHPGTACTSVRLTNGGVRADRLRLTAEPPARHWKLSWGTGGSDVSRQVSGGGYLTPSVAPGGAVTLCVRATRTDRHRTTPKVVLRAVGRTGVVDTVALKLRPSAG